VELLEKGEDDEVDENLGKNIFDPMVLITKGSEGKRVNPYHKNDLANKPKPMKQLRKRPRNGGVMETVSEEIVGRRRLLFLCFDEFQLNDIGKHTRIRHRRKIVIAKIFLTNDATAENIYIRITQENATTPRLSAIGDAVILKGLMQQLFAAGVVIVATGNRTPSELNRTFQVLA
jgi:hypothetical protein